MGHNCLGNLLKIAAKEANIQKKVTNHSVRKTTVTKLSQAGVHPQKIMKITGHRNIQSITHYDSSLTECEQKKMCSILQGQSQNSQHLSSPSPSLSVSHPTHEPKPNGIPAFLAGSTIHNCTFNI